VRSGRLEILHLGKQEPEDAACDPTATVGPVGVVKQHGRSDS
jgi:hypothetical protein